MASRQELEAMVRDAAMRYGVSPSIAYHQITAESAWNPRAVSSAGAQGLAQFMPATWAQYGGGGSPFDPAAAVEAWGKYMRDLLRLFGGDYQKALAGYNWGQGRVLSAFERFGADWLSHAPSETRNYVGRILSNSGGGYDPIIVEPGDGGSLLDSFFDGEAGIDEGPAISTLVILTAVFIVGVVLITK